MPDPGDPSRTVFWPGKSVETGAEEGPLPVPGLGETPGDQIPSASLPPSVPLAEPPPWRTRSFEGGAGQIAVGTVLNHVYRVERFIARGGMGEVYEGRNVGDPEDRVAIKTILPHLAADPNFQALFRNEVRALIRLSHPGLVQYRIFAQEPELGILYYASEFIDGPALSEVLTSIRTTPETLVRFIRHLASALAAAHALQIFHRDISPDNILLAHCRLDEAKIIDFGIAKNLAAAQPGETIVGSGFAGKLGYVAPEQFGDSRDVGPWTDVYSLGLVALAIAARRAPDMGVTPAEAMEKRRHVPDLSAAPECLKPILARMLAPGRAARFQSMVDLLAALDALSEVAPQSSPLLPRAKTAIARRERSLPLIIAASGFGVLLLAVLLGLGIDFLVPVHLPPFRTSAVAHAHAVPVVRKSDPARVRQVVETTLPKIGCSWLDTEETTPAEVKLSGLATDAGAVSTALSNALTARGVKSNIDVFDVMPVQRSACGVLDAFRRYRGGQGVIRAVQSHFDVQSKTDDCSAHQAESVLNLDMGKETGDLALIGMDAAGHLTSLVKNREEFEAAFNNPMNKGWQRQGGSYNFVFCSDEKDVKDTGPLLVIFLVTSQDHIPVLLSGSAGTHGGTTPSNPVNDDWLKRFAHLASENHWATQMTWYTVGTED